MVVRHRRETCESPPPRSQTDLVYKFPLKDDARSQLWGLALSQNVGVRFAVIPEAHLPGRCSRAARRVFYLPAIEKIFQANPGIKASKESNKASVMVLHRRGEGIHQVGDGQTQRNLNFRDASLAHVWDLYSLSPRKSTGFGVVRDIGDLRRYWKAPEVEQKVCVRLQYPLEISRFRPSRLWRSQVEKRPEAIA